VLDTVVGVKQSPRVPMCLLPVTDVRYGMLGVDDKKVMFLFTDAHVADEGFLELINNMLTSGMVPALYDDSEKDGLINRQDMAIMGTRAVQDGMSVDGWQRGRMVWSHVCWRCPTQIYRYWCTFMCSSGRQSPPLSPFPHRSVRPEVERKGLLATKESCWAYYVQKCRNNLHVVLAMSPVGETLRTRCRNFPGMVNNAVIDWFEPWPEQALQSVATVFLQNEELPDAVRGQIVDHMVLVHQSVRSFSTKFLEELRRHNYVTPKARHDADQGQGGAELWLFNSRPHPDIVHLFSVFV